MSMKPKRLGLELGNMSTSLDTLRRDIERAGIEDWTVESARAVVERLRSFEEIINDIKRGVDDEKRMKMRERKEQL